MTLTPNPAAESSALPPIVLLVEDDPEVLEMFSAHFQADGVWMATAVTPNEGLGAVDELRPDLVITDIGFGGQPEGVEFIRALKERERTRHIPIVVLTGLPAGDLPQSMRRDADLFLRKPIAPDALLAHVRRLLESSELLRARGDRARAAVKGLIQRSSELKDRAREINTKVEELAASRCPGCSRPLVWIERGVLGGHEYDYFHWCLSGCGLYCFERKSNVWTKLA